VTMPYRKLWSIIVGTSAIPSATTTAGGASAVAMKLIAAAAIGTATVGVTANELGTTKPEQTQPPRAAHTFAPSAHHMTPLAHPVFSTSFRTIAPSTTTPSTAARVTRHTVKAHEGIPAAVTLPPAVQPSVPIEGTPSTPVTPSTLVATSQPPVDPATPSVTQDAPPAAPADQTPLRAASDSTPATDPSAPAVAAATPADPTATPSTAAATATSDTDGGTQQAPPQGTPQSGPAQSNWNHLGVGQGSTPPGQATKTDSSHGKP